MMFSRPVHVVDISRITRFVSLVLISLAMMVITVHFYQADAVYARSTVLPVYILFFILMYLAGMLVEYFSLWCDRDKNFHRVRVAVNGLALLLVVYEMGVFYSSDRGVYSQLPTYSVTRALSPIVMVPSELDHTRI